MKIVTYGLAIVLALFSSSGFTQSQEEKPLYQFKKNAVGFGYVGVGELRESFWAAPGLLYRRSIKQQGILRAAIAGNLLNEPRINGYSIINSGIVAKVGYQNRILSTRISPIIGIDLSYGQYLRKESGFDGYQMEETAVYGGVSPNFGLEFWISEQISLAIETRLDLVYRQSTQEYMNVFWEDSNVTTSGFNTRYSPISLFYVNMNF